MERLPNEILFKILSNVPNLINYEIVNKRFKDIIDSIFDYYRKKFSKIIPEQIYDADNIKPIVRLLIEKKKIKYIKFLYNNGGDEAQKYINFYAGYFNDNELINLLHLSNYKYILCGAALNGNLQIIIDNIKRCIEQSKKCLIRILKYAIKGKQQNVINYINNTFFHYDLGDLDGAAINALHNGNINSLKDYLYLGANNYYDIAIDSAEIGNVNIIKIIIKYLDNDEIVEVANIAAVMDNLNIIKFIVKYLDNDELNDIVITAANNGNFNIVKYLLFNFCNKLDIADIIRQAIYDGNKLLVEYALEYLNNKENYQEFIDLAEDEGHQNIADYIRKLL